MSILEGKKNPSKKERNQAKNYTKKEDKNIYNKS